MRDSADGFHVCLHFKAGESGFAIHLPLPMFVYESIEGHAIFPAGGEVCDVDAGISVKQRGDVTD